MILKAIITYIGILLDKQYIFFGEIPNQPGHCILVTLDSPENDYVGTWELFRHDDFEEIPPDEL